MRKVLLNQTKYSGSESWARRVGGMPDYQVTAVYLRLLRAGEIRSGRKVINDFSK